MLQYLTFAPVLYVFWLLLSGHYNPLFLLLGMLSVLLVCWLHWRMDKIDQERTKLSLRLNRGLIGYALWLGRELIKSNLDVARRIWDPRLPIYPTWQRLDIKIRSPHEKTLYANSITITPGTLTTDVQEDHFMVHTLTPEAMEALREGEMERRISRLGL